MVPFDEQTFQGVFVVDFAEREWRDARKSHEVRSGVPTPFAIHLRTLIREPNTDATLLVIMVADEASFIGTMSLLNDH